MLVLGGDDLLELCKSHMQAVMVIIIMHTVNYAHGTTSFHAYYYYAPAPNRRGIKR